ncbi:MAG: electron transfer flavoprotein subunit alpha/FixB family protein [Dehalococcoidia bacterium]
MAAGVLVVAEIAHGGLSLHTREVMTAGRGVADALGEELAVLVLGEGVRRYAEDAIANGADAAYTVEAPELGLYQAELFLDLLEKTCRLRSPRLVLMPHSPLGCDLAPRLAYRLGSYWGAGCVGLRLDPDSGLVIQTRLIWGGKVLVDEVCQKEPAVATVRSKAYDPAARDGARTGRVEALNLAPAAATGVRTVQRLQQARGIADELREAEVVVSGGRGMGSAEAFDLLAEVAAVLGGAVGTSKAVVDAGWAPPERQVGLSGITVAPRLYMAVGVSGASQHMVGCNKAKVIVAINKDPQAPIFQFARYGVVGEWQKVLPPLLARLKEAR